MKIKEELMLTTFDNPYNPFKQFDEWTQFDEEKGYYTNNYLARIAKISFELSESEEDEELLSAMEEIISHDYLGIYKIVKESDYDSQNRLKMVT